MQALEKLIERIINRININLREPKFDVGPYLQELLPLDQLMKFYAFYGITAHHPLKLDLSHANLAGSYFLGKCQVEHAIVYKSDIRGDELKSEGQVFTSRDIEVPLHKDEEILIRDSFLIKTLIHNNSHNPENPEEFSIRNTAAMHYANIHGAPTEGCFLGPFSTVDLTTVHDSVIGTFAYVQAGEISNMFVEAGTIWVRSGDNFNFFYRFPSDVLERYIKVDPGSPPKGIFIDFIEEREKDFERIFDVIDLKPPESVPASTSLNRYAVIKRKSHIGENVLVAQRAYLDNAWMGRGANAQENCYIIDSRLEGNNVMAHGAKVMHAYLDKNVFVGFNSFLRGQADCQLRIGSGSIIIPHTIIDLEEPLEISPQTLVWGCIRHAADLARNSVSLESFAQITEGFLQGPMVFKGDGAAFVKAFQHRIDHILEANGAYFDGESNRGHAQMDQDISFNLIQPYTKGDRQGLYPTIEIRP